jgi:hypothetical protein
LRMNILAVQNLQIVDSKHFSRKQIARGDPP